MTVKEFFGKSENEKIGNFLNEMIACGGLCKKYCKGCEKAKWDCKEAVNKMLIDEIEEFYL